MAENKKYYWLKLKRDFFKRHDIRIIEEMPNGKDYILFYLKLLLESIDHEGSLRFSDTIPYNESMLSVVTNTNIDVVRSAMKLFLELGMMSICDDKTIYMTEVDKLIGSETEWAEKKRLYRENVEKSRTLSSGCPSSVLALSDKSKSIENRVRVSEKDTDTDTDLKKDKEILTTAVGNDKSFFQNCVNSIGKGVVKLSDQEVSDLIDKIGAEAFDCYVERLATWIINKKARVKSHYDTILKWVGEDSEVGN